MDLLKEDEFVPKKDDYNPWGGFMMFYGIAILCFIIVTYLGKYVKGTGYSNIYTFLFGVFMIIMPFIMIFSKRKNIQLPKRTILISVFVLTTLFFCLTIIDPLIKGNDYQMITDVPFIIYVQLYTITFVYGLICSGIILLIRWRKLKKLSATPQSSSL
jgi:uncharacterized membrane protein